MSSADAVSRVGAQGPMQLMPDTAKALGIADPQDARQNIFGGTKYLSTLLDRFNGNVALALASYNAGPTVVARHKGIPPYGETRRYVSKILASLWTPRRVLAAGPRLAPGSRRARVADGDGPRGPAGQPARVSRAVAVSRKPVRSSSQGHRREVQGPVARPRSGAASSPILRARG
jgi:hypothetical protein